MKQKIKKSKKNIKNTPIDPGFFFQAISQTHKPVWTLKNDINTVIYGSARIAGFKEEDNMVYLTNIITNSFFEGNLNIKLVPLDYMSFIHDDNECVITEKENIPENCYIGDYVEFIGKITGKKNMENEKSETEYILTNVTKMWLVEDIASYISAKVKKVYCQMMCPYYENCFNFSFNFADNYSPFNKEVTDTERHLCYPEMIQSPCCYYGQHKYDPYLNYPRIILGQMLMVYSAVVYLYDKDMSIDRGETLQNMEIKALLFTVIDHFSKNSEIFEKCLKKGNGECRPDMNYIRSYYSAILRPKYLMKKARDFE